MGKERQSVGDGPIIAGRYALYDSIASGGMATVHLGRLIGPIGFSRTVAVKRLHPQFAGDPSFVSMLVDEARLASRIRHPNVVPTLDVVVSEEELFLVLEYVHGETLSQLIKELGSCGGRIPQPIAASIVCGMLHGLHAAHNVTDEHGAPLGLVHRDVSPQNVLIGTDGVARLLDFGVAKAAGRVQVTVQGQLKGKVAYMAPEQVKGHVSPRSDVYAAAAVLWEALTCQRLFQYATWTNAAQMIMRRQPEPPSSVAPDLSPDLDEIVMRALSKDPDDRFASAREMALAIERCVPLAPTHEVGEWVERTAGTLLAQRARRIAEIERQTAGSKTVTIPPMTFVEQASRPPARGASFEDTRPDYPHVHPRRSELTFKEESTDANPGTALTQVSSQHNLRLRERKRSRKTLALLAALAIGVPAAIFAARRPLRVEQRWAAAFGRPRPAVISKAPAAAPPPTAVKPPPVPAPPVVLAAGAASPLPAARSTDDLPLADPVISPAPSAAADASDGSKAAPSSSARPGAAVRRRQARGP